MAKKKLCGIYLIRNEINKKLYIGQSVDIRGRWFFHKNDLRKNKHTNLYLQNAWNLEGEDSFTFEIIETCERDKEILKEREQYWINLMECSKREYGYNLCEVAGSMLGYKHTPETCKKVSDAGKRRKCSEETRKKRSNSLKGEKNGMFGKKHKPETIQLLKEASSGKNNPNFGKKWPKEVIQKMSDAKKGEKHPNFGKHLKPETKQKMREAAIGKPKSLESRKKMSESQKGLNSFEKHPNAKLTWEKVDNLRYEFENGILTKKQLQDKYDIKKSHLNKILRYAVWQLKDHP